MMTIIKKTMILAMVTVAVAMLFVSCDSNTIKQKKEAADSEPETVITMPVIGIGDSGWED